MFWTHLFIIFFFAILFSAVLAWGLGWRHPARRDASGVAFLFVFLILLFVMWAGSVWIEPWGPVLYGAPWLSLLLIGFFTALLLLAVVAPVRKRRPPTTPPAEGSAEEDEAVVATAFGLFFWILILGLLIAAAWSYLT
jgi:amino acid transporter